MHRRGPAPSFPVLLAATLAVVLLSWPRSGLADASSQGSEVAPSPVDLDAASKAFKTGQQQFAAGAFEAAGASFDQAYRRVPHPSALYNAARAWESAGNVARAAERYAQYLDEAQPDAEDRDKAKSALDQLRPRVARVAITTDAWTTVTVDDQPLHPRASAEEAAVVGVFVAPGSHAIRYRHEGAMRNDSIDAVAGETLSIPAAASETPPVPTPSPASPPGAAPTPPPIQPSPAAGSSSESASTHDDEGWQGWHPAVTIASASVTLAAGVTTIWSGIDTLEQRDVFDAEPTEANLEEGRNRQRRTNFFIGLTATAGVFTVVSVFLTDWGGDDDDDGNARLIVGPQSAHVVGRF